MRAIIACLAIGGALMGAGCTKPEPHPYPAAAQAQFNASCPANDAVCVCTWDQVTRSMTYEDYQAALETFRTDGTMDPRITRARTHCIENHRPSGPSGN